MIESNGIILENYIKNVIFKNQKDLYDHLKELSENIKKISFKKRPILIEFIGTCRSGKSTSINLIQDVLIKNGLNVLVIDEEYVKITKEINQNRNMKMNTDSLKYTSDVINEKISIYDNTSQSNYDIIIYDRGINDEFIWLDTFGATKKDVEDYDLKLQKRYVDLLIIMTCSVENTLKRKYLNSLSILSSKWTNKETMEKYLKGIEKSNNFFNKHSKKIYSINTDEKDKVLVALTITNKIIDELNEIS